jgi:branched-chain amino acid transport system substrate-binding protein
MQRILATGAALLAISTGAVHAQGISTNEILIGYVSAFTGPVAGPVKELTAGANLYLDSVNAAGGVNGRKIRVETIDDAFDPKKSAAGARTLIKDKGVFALMLTRGTPQMEAILPVLNETGTPMIAPSTGAAVLHEPVNPLVFNVRSKYQTEAELAIVQLAGQGIKRIVAIQVEDSFGKDVMVGYVKGFKKAGIEPAGVFTFERSATDLSPVAAKAVAVNPQAVVTIGSAKATASIVKSLRAKGSVVPIITLSHNSAQNFVKDLGDTAHGVIVMQVFPNPRLQSTALAVEMQRLAQGKPDFPLSHVAMEGFSAAKVLVEGLKRAGKSPTRKTFMAALEGMKKYDLGGGLTLDFGPDDHTGLDFAESSIINKRGAFTQ